MVEISTIRRHSNFGHWMLRTERCSCAFTSEEECKKGPEANAITIGIDTVLDMIQKHEEIGGIVINPFSDSIHITKARARNILTERKTEL